MRTATKTAPPSQDDLIGLARSGHQDAFRRLVEPHRDSLHAHCYRMTGSVHDADDALQDALLRAWRGLHRFEGRSALSTWLHQIATNVCLDALAGRHRRVLPIDYGPASGPHEHGQRLDESVWVEPYPYAPPGLHSGLVSPEARYELRESIELAFVTALQHLPVRQRAVLILRDVLAFSSREVAEMMETTTASVNSALQRARTTMDDRIPASSQAETMSPVGDDGVRELVDSFVEAFERGDVQAIVALLTTDVTFAMPPYSGWCRGREDVAESWLMPEGPTCRLRYIVTWANAQPAMAAYVRDAEGDDYVPIALDVLTLNGRQIAAVTAFRDSGLFARLGLPDRLPGVEGS